MSDAYTKEQLAALAIVSPFGVSGNPAEFLADQADGICPLSAFWFMVGRECEDGGCMRMPFDFAKCWEAWFAAGMPVNDTPPLDDIVGPSGAEREKLRAAVRGIVSMYSADEHGEWTPWTYQTPPDSGLYELRDKDIPTAITPVRLQRLTMESHGCIDWMWELELDWSGDPESLCVSWSFLDLEWRPLQTDP